MEYFLKYEVLCDLFLLYTEKRPGEMMNCPGSKGNPIHLLVYHPNAWYQMNIAGKDIFNQQLYMFLFC